MNDANINKMKNELHTVTSILVDVMTEAPNWHYIKKTADALFHARIVWKNVYQEDVTGEGVAVGGAPMPLGVMREAFKKP